MNRNPLSPSKRRGRATLFISGLLAVALIPLSEAVGQLGGTNSRAGGSGASSPNRGQTPKGIATIDFPLSDVEVPMPPDIDDYIKDMDAAIALGKALFWDIQAGSDGMTACASCHYNGGGDARSKNQLHPGSDGLFNTFESGAGGPNTTLESSDFPFHLLVDPNDAESTVLRSVNDVYGSAGVPNRIFDGITPGEGVEDGTVVADPVFNVGGCNVDAGTGRNAPTVINAVFFVRQFWDGRADFRFNGVNNWGDQDPDARVLKTMPDGSVQEVQISIDKASLASQAVGPIQSNVEMAWLSGAGGPVRTFPVIGQKLLPAAPLKLQDVHPEDMHLGHLSNSPDDGLTPGLTYQDMIEDAFVDEWWNGTGTFDGHSHMESNFSLFWGLSIMVYEAQLVSDQAPIDFFLAGDEGALTEEEQDGLGRFLSGGAGCADCHAGPEFAGGTWNQLEDPKHGRVGVERMGMAIFGQEFILGLTNIPGPEDPQVVGHDEFWFTDNLAMGNFVQIIRPDTGQAIAQVNIPHSACEMGPEGEPVESEIDMLEGPGAPPPAIDDEGDVEPQAEFALAVQAFGPLEDGSCGLRVIIEGEIDTGAGTPAGDYPVLVNGQEVHVVTLGHPIPEAVYDAGFYNIGVRPTSEDLGIGADGPFGPLSFTKRIQNGESSAMEFDLDEDGPVKPSEYAAVNGSFKASSLRNVALHAPYMHNGSMATLEQVVQFYSRGADFLEQNGIDMDPGVDGVGGMRNKPDEQANMVAFLSNALLDPRVFNESGPFSHPSLPRKVGAVGDDVSVVDSNSDGEADSVIDEIPATGINGGGGEANSVFNDKLAEGVRVSLDGGEFLFPPMETSDPDNLLVLLEEGASGCGITATPMDAFRTVRVNLTKRPTADVTVQWSVSDDTELGTPEEDEVTGEVTFLGSGELTFTTTDWFHPHEIVLVGIQDDEEDGSVNVTLTFDPFISTDPAYFGWALDPMNFVVEDSTPMGGELFCDPTADPSFVNGTEEFPFLTIADALNCSTGTGNIRLAAGVYAEDLLIESGSINIIAESGAVLQGSGMRPAIEIRGAATVGSYISGLEITGGAGEAGGVLLQNGASLTLDGCTIKDNSGNTAGGVLARNQATLSLVNCAFEGNSTMNGPGAVMSESGDVTVSGCLFDSNTGREGGALMVRNLGLLSVEDSVFVGNDAHQGGAVFNDGASVSLIRCSIVGNSASDSGGGIFARNNAVLTIDGTKVTNNSATNNAGGIFLDNSELVATRSTLATNGGESLRAQNNVAASLNSCILWEDGLGTAVFSTTGNGFVGEAEFSIVDSELVEDADDADPLFVDAANGDHNLQAGSPAIDSGDPDFGGDPDGSATDMGSHPFLGN